MSRKKTSPQAQRSDAVRERLEHLYRRRAAVINLIESLEAYHACQGPKPAAGFRIPAPPAAAFSRIEA